MHVRNTRSALTLHGTSSGWIILVSLLVALLNAGATVAVRPIYGNNMIIQRDRPFPVQGTATANKTITVTYNSQTVSTVSDAQGNWQLNLPAMSAKAAGSNFTITEAGANTLTFSSVVVGDVWLFSGQSNMAADMNYCNQPADVSAANFPGIRYFGVPGANLGAPSTSFGGGVSWSVCSSSTAGGYSAVAFYFARTIYTNQNSAIPLGLVVSSVGGTKIDPWLGPEGLTDIPTLAPLYSQTIENYGPFSLFNGMIYPVAPLPVKGVVWYQGENAEATVQSADSYYLKEKGLIAGWKRLFGSTDCAFYLVQIANSGTPPTGPTPVLTSGGWDADTRLQQGYAINLPHAGVASAIDIGDSSGWSTNAWLGWHPTNKWDVGGRLALWALKNDYGRPDVVPSGPVLRDVTISNNVAICTFDYAGTGLMAGVKPIYGTAQWTNSPLALFSIAGANGTWYWADATITGSNTLQLSSASVTTPKKIAYACWQNPQGANFYNSNGLPGLPFYVDDVAAKYTVTASAGTGGTISPVGAATYLKRTTALYTITPNAGYYIQDVKVDGVSVGSVTTYTFDPLYANHTIAATFTTVQPTYAVTASANPGGSLTPSGSVNVSQGGSQAFSIKPAPGNLYTVSVDGKPMGARSTFLFSDVRAPHTISVVFSCTIGAQAGYGGTITPNATTTINYGSSQTFTITPSPGFAIFKVTVDGTNAGSGSSFTFANVTNSHTITATFVGTGGSGSVPQQSQMLFSCLTDTLPSSGTINTWSTYLPSGLSLAKIGTPTVEIIDSRKFERNVALDYDGFRLGSIYSSAIACSGASIVVVAKPIRNGESDGNWRSIVDIFYDRLVLGLMNGSGKVCVRRNGSLDLSTATIPDGQTTILSMVVQSDGSYKVYANGGATPVLTGASTGTGSFVSLNPLWNGGGTGFWSYIDVGRNDPDGWTTFNGYIGDVFVYKTALTDTERASLEQYLAGRLVSAGGSCTITASAGPGGSISPSGDVLVTQGANRTFTVTPDAGFAIQDVVVNGLSKGALASYTFTNITAFHTIQASFIQKPVFSSVVSTGTELVLVSTGAANTQSRVWTSTNVAAPANQWIAVKTNLLGADGRFTNRIAINPVEQGRYYMLTTP